MHSAEEVVISTPLLSFAVSKELAVQAAWCLQLAQSWCYSAQVSFAALLPTGISTGLGQPAALTDRILVQLFIVGRSQK